jgi:hypothetical protein
LKPFATKIVGKDYLGFMGEKGPLDFMNGDKIEFDGKQFTAQGQAITGWKPGNLLENLLSEGTVNSDADTPDKEEVAENETIQINNINELKNGEMIVVVSKIPYDTTEVNAATLPAAKSTFYFLDDKEHTYKPVNVPIGTILQIVMTHDSKFKWKVIKSPSNNPSAGILLVSPPSIINQACSQKLVAKVRGNGFGESGSYDPVKDAAVGNFVGKVGRMLG